MQKIIIILLILFSFNGFTQTLTIGDYNMSSGSNLVMSIEASGIQNLGAATLFIGYDSQVLQFDTVLSTSSQLPGMLINNMEQSSQVGIVWSAFTSGVNVTNPVICEIRFNYLGGECVLSFNNGCELADFSANVISTSLNNGSISESFFAEIINVENDYCTNQGTIGINGTPAGGTFYFDGSVISQIISQNYPIGTYNLSYVYENNFGFSDTAVQSITFHNLPSYTLNQGNISCFGLSDGNISVNNISGNAPFNFQWSNNATDSILLNLTAGSYQVSISDLFCTILDTVTLSEPEEIITSTNITHASSILLNDGAINLTVDGGVSPYTFYWSNASTSEDLLSLTDGYYSYTITDANSCTQNDSVWVRAYATQTLNIPVSWSMFSLNVEALDPYIDSLLSSYEDSVKIVKDGQGNVFWPEYGINDLNPLAIGEGYQIKLINALQIDVSGYYIYPEDTEIDLPLGWSIMGYLRTSSYSVETAFSTLVQNVKIIKSGSGTVYWPEFGINTLINLFPGEGYQIKMDGADSITFPAN